MHFIDMICRNYTRRYDIQSFYYPDVGVIFDKYVLSRSHNLADADPIGTDTHKGGNGGKIQAMGTSHYFIVCQVTLLGVSDHCVKKTKCMPFPHENIDIFKSYGLCNKHKTSNGFRA